MDEDTEQLNRVFAALADPTRRHIVARLADADVSVGELAEPYDMSLQAISKHVKVLEEAGLVTRSREAQRRPVHLNAEVFSLMTKWIERAAATQPSETTANRASTASTVFMDLLSGG